MTRFRLKHRRALPWLYLLLLTLTVGLVGWAAWVTSDDLAKLVAAHAVSIVGAAAALTFFLFGQHRDETRLFFDHFEKFNARFDKMNGPLNAITNRMRDDPAATLKEHEKQDLSDYFNLCAEEHLLAESGYLDHEVWATWCRGMLAFADVPQIRQFWAAEIASGAYYGFKLADIERHRTEADRSLKLRALVAGSIWKK